MAQLLTDLLEAGLIEKLDGSDERFARMEKAATALATALRARPALLIPSVLAGLDPGIPADDPMIAQAQQALVAEWKSMTSIHTSPPVNLLRSILLDACFQAGEGKNAAILWLTAADTWPLMRLGKEEACLRRTLEEIARRAEEVALVVPADPAPGNRSSVFWAAPDSKVALQAPKRVDRDALLQRIGAAVGPHLQNQQQQSGANPHWSNNGPSWSFEFAPRMRALLADELDMLSGSIGENFSLLVENMNSGQASMAKFLEDALAEQERRLQSVLASEAQRRSLASSRLQSLWWSEALYSSSLHRGYRELPPTVAAIAMAGDLLSQSPLPTPASVAYLIAETVHRLPKASFEERKPLSEHLAALRSTRKQLPSDWLAVWGPVPTQGRLSIRDLVALALGPSEWAPDEAMRRAGLKAELQISHPELARAVFRQEQAVRLAAEGK